MPAALAKDRALGDDALTRLLVMLLCSFFLRFLLVLLSCNVRSTWFAVLLGDDTEIVLWAVKSILLFAGLFLDRQVK